MPTLVAVLATAGALTQVTCTPLFASESGHYGWLAGHVVEGLGAPGDLAFPVIQGLVPAVAPLPWSPFGVDALAPLSRSLDGLRAAMWPATAFEPVAEPAPVPAPVATRADTLRTDSVQQARVPMPAASPLPSPLRLTAEQRRIAAHIAQTYRVAAAAIEPIVFHAHKVASEFRLEPNLLLAVMAVESSFNPFAESAAGAQGLMQVLTRVHKERFERFGGIDAAWDPLANIKVGAGILAEYLQRYGDLAGALKAYVGAALLDHDRGYGSKVMARRDAFDAVVRGSGPAADARTARAGPNRPSATARNGYADGRPVAASIGL